MFEKTTIRFLIFVLAVLASGGTTVAQHPVGWSGFEFKQVNQTGFSVYTLFYEITKDYTISLPDYFLDGSKLPEGTADEAGFYESWARMQLGLSQH